MFCFQNNFLRHALYSLAPVMMALFGKSKISLPGAQDDE